MFTAVEGIFLLLKTIFKWFGANDDKMKWLAKAADELHAKGWAREKIIMDLDEMQNDRLEKQVRALMVEKKSQLEPMRLSAQSYEVPEIIDVDVDMKTQGKYLTKSGNARGLVVHYTAGRMENGDKDAINTVKSMAKRGLGCLVMSSTGKIFKSKDQGLNEVAWHAGKSSWKGKTGISRYCMGMEICCPGKLDENGKAWFGTVYNNSRDVKAEANRKAGKYAKFSPEQEKSLIDFCLWQLDVNPEFDIDWICGHDEIAPARKSDPGGSLNWAMPAFRWIIKDKFSKGI